MSNLISPSQYVAFNREAWNALTPLQKYALRSSGRFHRRADQVLPDTHICLVVGARGWGKSAAVAWKINELVDAHPGIQVAVCAQDEMRTYSICVDWLIRTAPPWNSCELHGEKLHWANGSTASIFSAEAPTKTRGGSYGIAWLSEVAFWPKSTGLEVFANLKTATRNQPQRMLIDTSPATRDAVLEQAMNVATATVTGTMHQNIIFDRTYIQSEHKSYRGAALRREVYGEIVDAEDGAAFEQRDFDDNRVDYPPRLSVSCIGIDPARSTAADSDSTGFVVVGRAGDGTLYTVRDLTDKLTPEALAELVIAEHRDGAAGAVVETNSGGHLLRGVLKPWLAQVKVQLVLLTPNQPMPAWRADRFYLREVHWHRSGNKVDRAVGPAQLTRAGKVKFCGVFPELEDQACTYSGERGQKSPDNLDAFCLAVSELGEVNTNRVVRTSHERQREADGLARVNARLQFDTNRRDLTTGVQAKSFESEWRDRNRARTTVATNRRGSLV